jgi:iron-sulfur cluster assembly protein
MALDEPKADDEVFEDSGVKFVMNKELFDEVKPVTVDYIETERGAGFSVKSSLNKEASCGSGSCSC